MARSIRRFNGADESTITARDDDTCVGPVNARERERVVKLPVDESLAPS